MKKFLSTTRGSSHHTSQNKKISYILITAVVSVVLIFLVPRGVAVLASTIIAPINYIKFWALESGSSLPQFIRNRSELLDELHTLQEERATASSDMFTIKGLLKENKELRNLLGDGIHERILAGVIGRPDTLPYDILMIDKGTTDGVKEGAPVFITTNTVVGVIKNATAHTALVELVTTDGFEATVYVSGPDIFTNAVGIGGGQMRIGVPQGIPLQEGDIVFLPAVDSGIYGEISVVQSEPSNPEQYGYVSPDIPINSIRFVSVGKNPLENISFEQAQEQLMKNIETVFAVPVPETILVDLQVSSSSLSDNLENYEE